MRCDPLTASSGSRLGDRPLEDPGGAAGLARRNSKRMLSLLLAGLAIIVLATGIALPSGTVSHIGPFTVLWVHVATALPFVPLIAWHYEARNTTPRPADLSRRNLSGSGV